MTAKTAFGILLFLFIFLFVYTGVSKILLEHEVFYQALFHSPLLQPFSGVLSWLIPSLELAIAISLLIPSTQRIALYGFLAMMSIFAVYIAFMLYFRSERPCSCGGIMRYMNWHQHLYFNILFTLLAALALWLNSKIRRGNKKLNQLIYNI